MRRATLKLPATARWAFETVWWARHTRSIDAWEQLKNDLRPYATADRAAGWANWALIEPEWVSADYEEDPVEPLWAMEWLRRRHAARLPVNDLPLRNQMVERLINAHGDPMGIVVLRFFDALQSGKAMR